MCLCVETRSLGHVFDEITSSGINARHLQSPSVSSIGTAGIGWSSCQVIARDYRAKSSSGV